MSRPTSCYAAIQDILLLIRTGRVGMATTVLEGLIYLIDDVMMRVGDHAYEEGRHDMAREIAGKKRRTAAKRSSRKPRKHDAKPIAGRVHDRQPTRVEGGP
jgi:hypothetical protein